MILLLYSPTIGTFTSKYPLSNIIDKALPGLISPAPNIVYGISLKAAGQCSVSERLDAEYEAQGTTSTTDPIH